VKLPDQFREVLGIDPRRQFTGPNKITEHNGQLTPFRASQGRWRLVFKHQARIDLVANLPVRVGIVPIETQRRQSTNILPALWTEACRERRD
jgi:hypothetical protein